MIYCDRDEGCRVGGGISDVVTISSNGQHRN